MRLKKIYGHEALLQRLGDALSSGRFPQAALLMGPPGSGKQRVALWVAQHQLCETGVGVGCGECPACSRVLQLRHPDLHWLVPVQRLKATDPKKRAQEAMELVAQALDERREEPLYRRPTGMVSHPLASIRNIQRVVSLTPFMARKKVLILGNAERLVVQEASQEAANALLKVLEEPPDDTLLMLTTSEPQALLPTIRSRLIPIRVGRVGDEAVREFLTGELAVPLQGEALERRILAAEGRIGFALAGNGGDESSAGRAHKLLEAARQGPEAWASMALSQPPWAARGDFSGLLDALSLELRSQLIDHVGDVVALQQRVEALQQVEELRAAAQGNANPQLAVAVLADELEQLL